MSDICLSILDKNIFTCNNGGVIYKYIYFESEKVSPCIATIYYSLSYNSEHLYSLAQQQYIMLHIHDQSHTAGAFCMQHFISGLFTKPVVSAVYYTEDQHSHII